MTKQKHTETEKGREAAIQARRAAEIAAFYRPAARADALTPGALLVAEAKAARAARRASKFNKR